MRQSAASMTQTDLVFYLFVVALLLPLFFASFIVAVVHWVT